MFTNNYCGISWKDFYLVSAFSVYVLYSHALLAANMVETKEKFILRIVKTRWQILNQMLQKF